MKKPIKKMVSEELKFMLREAEEKAPKVAKKLEEMRKKLKPEMTKNESLGVADDSVAVRRVQISEVAAILDIPVNELMLHFMNEVKNRNERSLVEYHLGHVYFYADDSAPKSGK